MRVIAVIDDARVVENILRHLGAWHDPPAKPRWPRKPAPKAPLTPRLPFAMDVRMSGETQKPILLTRAA
jgi:hypothetical protein